MYRSMPSLVQAIAAIALSSQALGQEVIVIGGDDAFSYRATLPNEPFFKGNGTAQMTGYLQAHFDIMNDTALKVNLDMVVRSDLLVSINWEKIKDGDCDTAGDAIDSGASNFIATTIESGTPASVKFYEDEHSAKRKTLSLRKGDDNFVGERSFVVQFASNLTRIACANFELRGKPPVPFPVNKFLPAESSAEATAKKPESTEESKADDEGAASTYPLSLSIVALFVATSLFV